MLTGLSAVFLWPVCIRLCWPLELRRLLLGERDDSTHLIDLYLQLALPVGVPLSLLAGYGVHMLLADVLVGASSTLAWTTTALPLLGGVCGVGALYFGTCSPSIEALFWEERLEADSGKSYSLNARTGERRAGSAEARAASESRALLKGLAALQLPLYRRLRGWAAGLLEAARSSDDELEQRRQDRFELAAAPSASLLVSGGVQPTLRLVDVDEHARLLCLVDALCRYAYLRSAIASGLPELGGGFCEIELARVRREGAAEFGVRLEVLFDCLCAAVGSSMMSPPPDAEAAVAGGGATGATRHALLDALRRHALQEAPVPVEDEAAQAAALRLVRRALGSLGTFEAELRTTDERFCSRAAGMGLALHTAGEGGPLRGLDIDFCEAAQQFSRQRVIERRVAVGTAPVRFVAAVVASIGHALRQAITLVAVGAFLISTPVHIWALPFTWPAWIAVFAYISGEGEAEQQQPKKRRRELKGL